MIPSDLPTRHRIIAAAEPLFAAHGFGGVTLRAVAAAARVPLGGIAYHFGSKEGLYRAIWDRWMARARVEDLLDHPAASPGVDREQAVRRIIDALFAGPKAILQDEGGDRFIAIMVREAHDPTSIDRDLMDTFVRPNALRIRAALAEMFPSLAQDRFDVCFLMTISALRIVIEDRDLLHAEGLAQPSDLERRFAMITDFIVHGWMEAEKMPTA